MKVIALLFTLSNLLLIGKGHFMHKMCITKYISKKKQKQKTPNHPLCTIMQHSNICSAKGCCTCLVYQRTHVKAARRGEERKSKFQSVSNFSDRVIFSHLMSDSELSFENDVVTTGVPLLAK